MIARTPPMGWNSWDCWGAAVTEETVLQNARFMRDHLKEAGYEYVVVDIEWYQPSASSHAYEPFSELTMDEYGRLLPAVNRFPSAAGGKGFAPLAEEIHNMGLKFGIHIMRGLPRMAAHRHLPIEGSAFLCSQAANPNSICAWNPDMYGLRADTQAAQDYYDSIFRLYASWGVDYVKCDDIAREYPHCEREIEIISQARDRCGRDIVLSLSPGPAPLERAEHLKKYANLWRITDDFWDDWKLLKPMFERTEKWCVHAGPGHWPDQDMLPVGALRQCTDPDDHTHFTKDEQVTMMTLWCMARSPLMIGAELPKMDDWTLSLLTNRKVLDILSQTCAARMLRRTDEDCVMIAYRTDGQGAYLARFNLSDDKRPVPVDPGCLEISFSAWEELWSGASGRDALPERSLPAHGAEVYRLFR